MLVLHDASEQLKGFTGGDRCTQPLLLYLQANTGFGDPSPESPRVGVEWGRGGDWGHLQARSHEVPCPYDMGYGVCLCMCVHLCHVACASPAVITCHLLSKRWACMDAGLPAVR